MSILTLFLKGILMGAADVVPGVSGGTIAVVLGIYQMFIDTLSKLVSKESLRMLKEFKLKDYFFYINAPFILPLACGIFFSIFVFSHLVIYLYEKYPILLWSFFVGLILASVVFLMKMSNKFTLQRILTFVLGTVLAYFLVSINPVSQGGEEANYLVVFLSGMVALSAMMLPGISGSFLLVILGQYTVILTAVKDLNIPIIILFSTGGVISLLFFSKFINWLMKRHFHISIMLLSGFLLGSLKTIWPWKIEENGNPKNVLPFEYKEITSSSHYLEFATLFFFVGILLVTSVEIYKSKVSKKDEKIFDF